MDMFKQFFSSFKFKKDLVQSIIGIDISHKSIKAVQLSRKKADWTIVASYVKHIDAANLSEDSLIVQMIEALREVRSYKFWTTNKIAVAVNVDAAIVQVIQIPFLPEKELRDSIAKGEFWGSYINLPGELNEYSIGWQILSENPKENQISLIFIAVRTERVSHLYTVVKKSGLIPIVIDVRCFSVYKAYTLLNRSSHREHINIFLELSGHDNYIACFYKNMPFISDIQLSDRAKDILISGVMDAEMFQHITSQISTALSTFAYQHELSNVGIIRFLSSLDHANSIEQWLKKEMTDYQFQLWNPLSEFQTNPTSNFAIIHEKNPSSFAVALGLSTNGLIALNNTEHLSSSININLVPNKSQILAEEKQVISIQHFLSFLAMGALLLLLICLPIHRMLVASFHSQEEVAVIETNVTQLKTTKDSLYTKVNNLNKVVKDLYENDKINRKVIDISYLWRLPEIVFVEELRQGRETSSEIVLKLKSPNPNEDSVVMDIISSQFKNVKLSTTEVSDSSQISKITFQIN